LNLQAPGMGSPAVDAAGSSRRGGRRFALLGLLAGASLVGPPAYAASPDRGQQIYASYCASCHGSGGTPVWPGAPDFKRAGSLMRPDGQLVALIRQGRGAMPAYLGIIKDREMLDLIAYLRTLN
jgi:cytochrome c6